MTQLACPSQSRLPNETGHEQNLTKLSDDETIVAQFCFLCRPTRTHPGHRVSLVDQHRRMDTNAFYFKASTEHFVSCPRFLIPMCVSTTLYKYCLNCLSVSGDTYFRHHQRRNFSFFLGDFQHRYEYPVQLVSVSKSPCIIRRFTIDGNWVLGG